MRPFTQSGSERRRAVHVREGVEPLGPILGPSCWQYLCDSYGKPAGNAAGAAAG
jgi:hypothetical protein